LGEREVRAGAPTLLIAEIGSNHNRSLDLARTLIDTAAEAGWDAVKFQLFRAAWLYPSNCGRVATPQGEVDFFDVLHEAELPPEWLGAIRQHAHERGLPFLCTPFDEEAVTTLAALGVDAFKVASPELNHLPLLRAVARTGKPIICSTGLCTLADAQEALATIAAEQPAAGVALLQCTTAYPTPPEQANLGVIATLAAAFGVPTGLSDHTMDCELVPAAAVAVGACIIEKHVTMSRSLPGPDHAFALEPAEMKRMAAAVRDVDATAPAERRALVERRWGRERVAAVVGHGRKEIMPCEAELYPCDKRSIVALRAISPGEPLSIENVRILRSERNLPPGLHPRHWDEVLGARTTRAVAAGHGVNWIDLLAR
jgi:N,N'-diacetyllegionaminate synthase